jgi:hypothetical protein
VGLAGGAAAVADEGLGAVSTAGGAAPPAAGCAAAGAPGWADDAPVHASERHTSATSAPPIGKLIKESLRPALHRLARPKPPHTVAALPRI